MGISQMISSIRKRWLFSGVRTTAMVSGATLALGSAAGVLLARGLGPTARGEFVAASVGPQVVATLTILGIDDALVYRLARSTDERDSGRVYGSALALAGIIGLMATGVAVLLQWFFFGPAARGVAPLTLFSFATFPFVNITTQVMLGAMRARQQFALWNSCRLVIPIAYLILLAGLAVTHNLAVSSAVFALYASNLMLFVYLALHLTVESRLSFSPRVGSSLLHLGVQNHMIDVGQLVNQRIDQAILTRLVSPTQLGFYAIAVTYAGLPLVIALAPSLHLYSETSRDGMIAPERFRALQRRTTVAMVIAAGVAALAAPEFMTIVFGPAFRPAAIPAAVLALGAPPLALAALRTAVWKGSGKPLPAAAAQAVGILVTVVGLGVFATRFGIIAAAITSVVAYLAVTAVLFAIHSAPVVRAGAVAAEVTSTASDPPAAST